MTSNSEETVTNGLVVALNGCSPAIIFPAWNALQPERRMGGEQAAFRTTLRRNRTTPGGRSATRRTGARWHGRKERSRPDKGAKVLDQFFSQISFVDIFNFCVFLTFTICYTYQLYYVFVVLTRKPKELTAKKNHKFAAVISARYESAVIGDLIHSI